MTLLILALTLLGPAARAADFVPQTSVPLPLASLNAVDRDAAGNLYVLGMPPGAATYTVSSYQTQGLQPLFSFDTGAAWPAAFAVEGSGTVDLLDLDSTAGTFILKRFDATGTPLGTMILSYTFSRGFTYSGAIDKVGKRVYLSKFWFIQPCLDLLSGCSGPPSGTVGVVYQYDFQGNLLRSITLPGNTSSQGSCYEPRAMAVDAQGTLFVADTYCHHLLSYQPDGTLLRDAAVGAGFTPTAIWTDPSSHVYGNPYVCSGSSCLPGLAEYAADGTLLAETVTAGQPAPYVMNSLDVGCAWDDRITYVGSTQVPPLRRFVLDGAPATPAETGPIASSVQHSSAAALSWQGSADPDGDPVLYSVYLGTAASGLRLVGETAATGLTSAPLQFGATYFWQVIARDSYQGLAVSAASAPIVSFNLGLRNAPPGDFAALSGAGTAVTRSTAVVVSWQAATDPDGDSVVYDLSWRSSSSTPTVVVTTATWMPESGLSFGTTYYWSVTARDPYGAVRAIGGGVEQAYTPVFLNNPPPAPAVLEGAGTTALHTLTPALRLAWSSSADPEGDPVSYRLSLGTAAASLAEVQDGSTTAFGFSPTLGTTYYWQVTAYDSYGASSATALTAASVELRNAPPAPFSVLSGSGTAATRLTSWPLAWEAASDPDGDAVSYALSVGTAPEALDAVPLPAAATGYSLSFEYGTTYYWRVTAEDGFGGRVATPLQVFRADFLNAPPEGPGLSPVEPLVKTMAGGVEVSWSKVTSPQGDALTYTALVGDSPSSLVPVAAVEQSSAANAAAARVRALGAMPAALVQDRGDAVVLSLRGLDYYRSYFLQVQARTVYGAESRSPVRSFSLAPADAFPRAYNYPNPFSPGQGGTHLVFNAPPSGYARAVLTVYSEFGREILRREYGPIPPGVSQALLDGRDGSGRPLDDGSYVARVVFDGPSDRATFYLLVVK